MINYEPTFLVTPKEEEALIPGPGFAGDPGARFGSAAPLEYEALVRSDIPTGSWSLNMSCGSVDI